MKGLEILTLRKEARLKQHELAALLICKIETVRRPTPRCVERKIQRVLKKIQTEDEEIA